MLFRSGRCTGKSKIFALYYTLVKNALRFLENYLHLSNVLCEEYRKQVVEKACIQKNKLIRYFLKNRIQYATGSIVPLELRNSMRIAYEEMDLAEKEIIAELICFLGDL